MYKDFKTWLSEGEELNIHPNQKEYDENKIIEAIKNDILSMINQEVQDYNLKNQPQIRIERTKNIGELAFFFGTERYVLSVRKMINDSVNESLPVQISAHDEIIKIMKNIEVIINKYASNTSMDVAGARASFVKITSPYNSGTIPAIMSFHIGTNPYEIKFRKELINSYS